MTKRHFSKFDKAIRALPFQIARYTAWPESGQNKKTSQTHRFSKIRDKSLGITSNCPSKMNEYQLNNWIRLIHYMNMPVY